MSSASTQMILGIVPGFPESLSCLASQAMVTLINLT